MDLNRYRRLQPEGFAELVKGDPAYLSFKRFDPENGKELDPELQQVDVSELHRRQLAITAELDTINSLLSQLR